MPVNEMLTDGNKAVVRRFVEAMNRRDLDALDELVAEDVVRHCQATPNVAVSSLADFKRFLEADLAVFPDSVQTIHRLVAEGNVVAVHVTYAATQEGPLGPLPPSGRRLEVELFGMLRLRQGKIVEMWLTWDNLTALAQLGHVQPPAVAEA